MINIISRERNWISTRGYKWKGYNKFATKAIINLSFMLVLPLNNSTSKQKYSFSQSPRFKMPRPQSSMRFYDIQSTKSKRHTTFGIGERSKMFEGRTGVP